MLGPVFKCLLGRRQQPALHEQVSASVMSSRCNGPKTWNVFLGSAFLSKADCPGGSGALLNIKLFVFSAGLECFLPDDELCERDKLLCISYLAGLGPCQGLRVD